MKIFATNFDDYDGVRQNNIIMAKIYFHFTLFLPSAFAYFLYKKNYLKTILLSIAIMLSVSRGAIMITALISVIYILNYESVKGLVKKLVLLFITSLVLIQIIDLLIPKIFFHLLELNNSSNFTVSTRISQIDLVLDAFSDNIKLAIM